MESVEKDLQLINRETRFPIGSERFTWKDGIKYALYAGALGALAGVSLVAAAAQHMEIHSYLLAPLVLGLGFGLLGFAYGGFLRSTETIKR